MVIDHKVKYIPDWSNSIVIVDIDSTIAAMHPDRKQFIEERRKDWDAYYEMSFDDTPIGNTIQMVQLLFTGGYKIVFCTGRRESVREQTMAWLREHVIYSGNFQLLMRPEKNRKCDSIVKPKLLEDAGIEKDHVLCIFEDRNRVVKKWRDLGFHCLQVAEGNY